MRSRTKYGRERWRRACARRSCYFIWGAGWVGKLSLSRGREEEGTTDFWRESAPSRVSSGTGVGLPGPGQGPAREQYKEDSPLSHHQNEGLPVASWLFITLSLLQSMWRAQNAPVPASALRLCPICGLSSRSVSSKKPLSTAPGFGDHTPSSELR